VWNASKETIRQHLCIVALSKAKVDYIKSIGIYHDCLYTPVGASLLLVITYMSACLANMIFITALSFFCEINADDYLALSLWSSLVITLIVYLITRQQMRKIIQKIKVENDGKMPPKPSENWKDYTSQIPAIDFPLPPNQE